MWALQKHMKDKYLDEINGKDKVNVRNYIFACLDKTEQCLVKIILPQELLSDVLRDVTSKGHVLALYQLSNDEAELMLNKEEEAGILVCKIVD